MHGVDRCSLCCHDYIVERRIAGLLAGKISYAYGEPRYIGRLLTLGINQKDWPVAVLRSSGTSQCQLLL